MWSSALSLIFGGCCTNAITLEQITSLHPNAGSVVTFFQYLVVALHGLPSFLIWTRFGPRFRPRRLPLLVYLAQVVLFYLVSVLNNASFAFHVPMAVHIIFRSGSLVVTMILGYLLANKSYNRIQIASVILVTAGVVLTTLSAKSRGTNTIVDPYVYAQGILILGLALVLSGFLGILQDWAHKKRTNTPILSNNTPPAWQESMFYIHFLALPLFLPLLPNLAVQMHELNLQSQRDNFSFPIPIPFPVPNATSPYSIPQSPFPIYALPHSNSSSPFLSISRSHSQNPTYLLSLSIPHIYLPLVLNTLTQLLCIAGVHRLTTRVSALTLNLVLVIRKALSLVISVIGIRTIGDGLKWNLRKVFGEREYVAGGAFMSGIGSALFGEPSANRPQAVDLKLMCVGAGMVLLGTLGYALGSVWRGKSKGGVKNVKAKVKEE